jgi:hypothetical protein
MDIDIPLSEKIDALLRSDERLAAAAPLIGQVAAVYKEAPPSKAADAPLADKPKSKKPPNRVDGVVVAASFRGVTVDLAADEEAGEVTLPPPGPPACPSPWFRAAVLSKANGLAKFEDGKPVLAVVTIHGAEWDLLNGAQQTAALVLALRGLRHKERASDGASLASIEKPPIRCWPDVREEASELMAALCEDPAQAAALAGSLSPADPIEALDAAVSDIIRSLAAGQTIDPDRIEAILCGLDDALQPARDRETA